jgi:hypothetical protein
MSGTLDIQQGNAELRYFQQQGGTWNVAAGANIDISYDRGVGNVIADTAITGGGYIQFRGGSTALNETGAAGTMSYGLPVLYVNGGDALFNIDTTVDNLYLSGDARAREYHGQ